MAGFLQTPPLLDDAWSSDRILREAVEFHVGEELFASAEAELAPIGAWATSPPAIELALRAESEPPIHTPYAPWGERIDDIRVSDAYVELGKIGVRAGVAALPYEETSYGPLGRVVWGALVTLWGPSSALYSCPIAMTDGAARTLMLHGSSDAEAEIVRRLTTRDPNESWTSGQWMTETAGGSDVSRTGTVARREADGTWRLWGTKWFTSSTVSEMALALARPEGAPEGSKGLGLFRVHRHLDDGTRNAIVVRRLKDKLGTRALPTAELELEGALAYPVGDALDGGGVRRVATMLNITRVHNSIGGTGGLARGLAFARAYARVREVFGRPLHSMPAHRATLTDLAVDYQASLALTLRCCELLGKEEKGTASSDEQAVLRGLTPLTKLATGRWSIAGVTEAMEAIGGVGYCEDSGMPVVVRNAHVIPIWEGTSNVMALDFLRAAVRARALEAIAQDIRSMTERLRDDPHVGEAARSAEAALKVLEERAGRFMDDLPAAEANARSFALGLATTYATARLAVQGAWAAARGDARTAAAARRLAARGLVPPEAPEELELGMDEELN